MTGIVARCVCWSKAMLREGTAGVLWMEQVTSWQLSNCHTKLHQGVCMWLHSYCANDTWAPGGSTWRKLFKSNKSVWLLLLLSTVYWCPSCPSMEVDHYRSTMERIWFGCRFILNRWPRRSLWLLLCITQTDLTKDSWVRVDKYYKGDRVVVWKLCHIQTWVKRALRI